MAVKTAFEPKDARINFDDRYYSDDFDEKREPRKRITGTQALVEFLNTTSPEEFQKNAVPKRSSALFFRRKGEKPTKNALLNKIISNTTSTSPHTIHRKNYIEIIANPFTFNKSNSNKPPIASPSSISIATTKNNSSCVMIGSELNRTLSKSTSIYSIQHQNIDKPVLPIRKGLNSVNTTTTTTSSSTAATTTNNGTQTSALTSNRRQFPSLRVSTLVDPSNQPAHSIFTSTTLNSDKSDDMIEGGLKQRLNHYQINSLDIPSDAISKSLAQEHVLALGVVSSMIMDEQQQQQEQETTIKKKKKSRHIQVQTMPYYPNESKAVTVQTEPMISDSSSSSNSTINSSNNTGLSRQQFDRMEQELKQERLKNSRLQAALEETRDQFEVLSGLAYKKLREVWEEKTKWENACIEAKERCWHDHQQQIMSRPTEEDNISSSFIDGTIMEFMLDQDAETRQEDEEEEEYLI